VFLDAPNTCFRLVHKIIMFTMELQAISSLTDKKGYLTPLVLVNFPLRLEWATFLASLCTIIPRQLIELGRELFKKQTL